jgi:hypothetical protein
VDPYSFFTDPDPDPDPELDVGGQYGSGSKFDFLLFSKFLCTLGVDEGKADRQNVVVWRTSIDISQTPTKIEGSDVQYTRRHNGIAVYLGRVIG